MTFLCAPFKERAGHLWADKKGRVILKGRSPSDQKCFFAGFTLIHHQCFSLFKDTDNHLFRDFVKRHHQDCFVYMQKDLKFFELGSLSSYMKSLNTCAEYLKDPLSKEGKLLRQILEHCLPAEFMQDDSHFRLEYLRRQFFSQGGIVK